MTATGTGNAPDVVDVVALGESMVTFLPARPGRLADVPSFHRSIGGAESNVACALAAAGHTTRWVSRVGADGFGDHLVEAIGAYGVDVSHVRRDPSRPTGVYFRTAGDRADDAHEVAYYRAGSAASAMSPAGVDLDAVRAGRVLHLSGITAALSPDCLDLMRELTAPRPARPLISFDVNHRPGLWGEGRNPDVLLALARGADIVFVGEDEAEEAWDITGGPATIRQALPEPGLVVVKQGAQGAVALPAARGQSCLPQSLKGLGGTPMGDGDPPARAKSRVGEGGRDGTPQSPGCETTPRPAATSPALKVDVVATTGAGDAFAAGFLSATLRGLPLTARLRHGHLMAAATLTTPGDLTTPPPRPLADRLAALDASAWETLRLGPGWTDADAEAAEEAPTP
ncbi:sugar kinase [Streptomyces sp. DSM 41972]|uniref:Sugar kinase n=1 Tax=Streptomyces althioticus subsp. attaecolombicae TaxID=3075534 RepID=A0ABU3HTE3_9ACTN|nr:sugar kinase [Streptomyces sp. DSM 41972]SCE01194.1 2-dehydro-3-deoxygluconokinase [Streptomyces sp. di50b]SCE19165.1 2-dehydro-3-deoxygluconokinase [Streptomyces sp. di188]